MKHGLEQRMAAFVQLGKAFAILASDSEEWPGFESGLTKEEFSGFKGIINNHYITNGWFTPQNVKNALQAWADELTDNRLQDFVNAYKWPEQATSPKIVAIICAGNIPMVGFHDIFCCLLAGHKVLIKLSSDDQQLIPAALVLLEKFWPDVLQLHSYASGKLENFDAVIATGSNNTGRYFDYYFKNYPHIIRKNRHSIAVITGEESEEELNALGKDIFAYFGLGCRNVTKVFIPRGYDIDNIFKAIYPYHPIVNHNKYANNYDYNKAIWLMNQEQLLDNGFILFKEDDGIAAPTGTLFYSYYDNLDEVNNLLEARKESIQCIVGKSHIPFGKAQCPALNEYADGVDTIQFLIELHRQKTV